MNDEVESHWIPSQLQTESFWFHLRRDSCGICDKKFNSACLCCGGGSDWDEVRSVLVMMMRISVLLKCDIFRSRTADSWRVQRKREMERERER